MKYALLSLILTTQLAQAASVTITYEANSPENVLKVAKYYGYVENESQTALEYATQEFRKNAKAWLMRPLDEEIRNAKQTEATTTIQAVDGLINAALTTQVNQ